MQTPLALTTSDSVLAGSRPAAYALQLSGAWAPALSSPSQQGSDVDGLLREYRTGNPESAITAFAAWTEKQISERARLPEHPDAWSLAALALLHFEAGESDGASGDVRDDVFHYGEGRRLLSQACSPSRTTGDPRLHAFCIDAYVVALASPQGIEDLLQEADRRFPTEAAIQLALGHHYEFWMNRIDSGGGYAKVGHPYESAVPARHANADPEVSRAESYLRKATQLAPDLTEARVRLGRVLWFLEKDRLAEQELLAAREQGHGSQMSYLSGLFLGQLYEDVGRVDDAAAAYATAIRDFPTGTVARIALGRLRLSRGDTLAGWATIREALAVPVTEPDPSELYPLGELFWHRRAAWRGLRTKLPAPGHD